MGLIRQRAILPFPSPTAVFKVKGGIAEHRTNLEPVADEGNDPDIGDRFSLPNIAPNGQNWNKIGNAFPFHFPEFPFHFGTS